MKFKKGDLVRLGPNINYINGNHPEAYQMDHFTEGMVIGRSNGNPEVIFKDYRHEPSLYSGEIETMFSDEDLEHIPGDFDKEKFLTELLDKGYRPILDDRSII
jgi:hypothetical protein